MTPSMPAIPPTGPLASLRVLDLGTMVAGPVACTHLADFGAHVIKIEQPNGGDTLRGIGPLKDGESLWWNVEGRNKQSVTLDLRKPQGQELLKRLVQNADVLVENFRPGTMDTWNIGYAALAAVNPKLIMLSVSGFGQTGPYAERAGYDRMGLAFSGVMGITGNPDAPPVRVGISVADYSTATLGAFAIMMALYHRDLHNGRGQHIDLALYETMFRFTDSMVSAYDQLGAVRTRTGNVHQAAAPGNTYATKDGRFIVMTISGDVLFKKLCRALSRDDMAVDARFQNHSLRWQHIHELNDVVAAWMAVRDAAEISAAFDAHGVPYAIVYTVEDIFQDPQYRARNNIIDVAHPRLGTVKMQGVVPKMHGTPATAPRAAPALGADNEDVFMGVLGLDRDAYDHLRRDGVI